MYLWEWNGTTLDWHLELLQENSTANCIFSRTHEKRPVRFTAFA